MLIFLYICTCAACDNVRNVSIYEGAKTKEVCNGGVACSLLKLAADKPRPLLQNSLVGSIYVTTYDTYRYLVVNFTVNYPKRGLTTI